MFAWIAKRLQSVPSQSPRPHRRRHTRLASLEGLEARLYFAASSVADDAALVSTGPSAYPRVVNGAKTALFPSVGMVGDQFGGEGTGTLIAPQYVLTAAHLASNLSDTGGRFQVGGVLYATSDVFVHPDYNGSMLGTEDANDIAILKLSQSVPGVAPSPIFRGTPQVGDSVTLVGFGGAGKGTSGSDGTYGTKRVGTTPLDYVSETLIAWNFESNTESNTAPGDSGGPAFEKVGGVFYVAGVTSGGTKADASIGDFSFDTRVDAYADWIDSILAEITTAGVPVVSIEAPDWTSGEVVKGEAANPGKIMVTRSGPTNSSLAVQLDLSGSATVSVDYETIATTVIIPKGQSSVTINFKPKDDTEGEATEVAVVGLHASSAYLIDQDLDEVAIDLGDNDASDFNDTFASRVTLFGADVEAASSNYSATREKQDPTNAGAPGGRSVWWSWSTDVAGIVTVSTYGSTFDTTLGVYTGTALKSLKLVTANDDGLVDAGDVTSAVTFAAKPGIVYQIMVDGFKGDCGEIALSIQLAAASDSKIRAIDDGEFWFPADTPEIEDDIIYTLGGANPFDVNTFRRMFFASNARVMSGV